MATAGRRVWTWALGSALQLWACAAGEARASERLRIELVTMEPGDPIWTRFGHSGLRVVDPDARTDIVYSYGYARFDRPSFAWEYLRGEARFRVGARAWGDVLARYERENRTVTRQPLLLSEPEAREIAAKLAFDARPENAEYRYDQLEDNCATRVRDVVDRALSGALREWADARTEEALPYRHFTLRAAAGSSAISLVLDLIGGPNQDRRASAWSRLYLPEALRDALSRVSRPSGPLAGPAEVVVRRQGAAANEGDPRTTRRAVVGVAASISLLSLLALRSTSRRLVRIAGVALGAALAVVGIMGVLVCLLVSVSRVADFGKNDNVFVWTPLELGLLVPCAAWVRRGEPVVAAWTRHLARAHLALLLALVLASVAGVRSQDNWPFVASAALLLAPFVRARPAGGGSAR